MAQVEVTQQYSQSPDAIWAQLGDPYDLKELLGVESRREGDVRWITSADGSQISERITAHDDAARTYSYEYLEGPLPVDHYVSTIRVDEDGDGSRVTWKADFAARGGSAELEQKLSGGIEKMYRGALGKLAQSQAPAAG
jgi:hypothetical protein